LTRFDGTVNTSLFHTINEDFMSTPLRQNLTFPVGRLIAGSVSDVRTKDKSGKQLTTKDGQAREEFSFGVAYEKNGTVHFSQTEWGAIAWNIGTTAFPHLFNPDGSLLPGRTFSWKITDGDSQEYNTEGNRPCDTPEWAGCWIVWFKSQFAPSTWNADGTQAIPATSIKPGNFVQVAGSIDANGDAGKPGIYMNHNMVALSGYHPDGEIKGGADPKAAGFGKGAKPANLQAVPASAFTPNVPAAGTPPVPAAAIARTPPPASVAPPAVGVRPHAGILQPGAGVVAPPGAKVPTPPPANVPAPPPAIQTTQAAGGATWAQLQAAGWTEDVARAHGMII
jgi:hypothetical protein